MYVVDCGEVYLCGDVGEDGVGEIDEVVEGFVCMMGKDVVGGVLIVVVGDEDVV